MAVDSLGHLWVGTDGGGAARIPASGFSSFNEKDGLGVRKVWAILEDPNGDLVAVTKDETHYSLSRFDGYRFHSERPRAPIGGIEFGWSWSHIAVPSRSGGWWLGTGDGILYYNRLGTAPVRFGPQQGLPAFGNMRVYEDSQGAVWVSLRAVSHNALYRRAPRASRFERMDEGHGLPSLQLDVNCPVAFAEDRSGQIWIGMLDGGLVRYREGRFQQFPPSSGAPDQGVRSLLVDSRGRLWIGSLRRGLIRVDDPTSPNPAFRAYTVERGLSANTALAMAEDRAGRIYAATGLAIDRLDPETGRIRAFTTADGVPANEFRVALRDRHGTIWFGGDTGLLRLEPREEHADPPKVLVYAIRVNGQPRLLSDFGDTEPGPLSLGSSERQVQVQFGGFRHDLLYQTLLYGVDSEWTPPSASRSVHYLALASGSYKLAIRAVSPDGGVSPNPAWVRFRIAEPVWQRWWFLSAFGSAVAGLLFFWHRSQLERRLAIERVRSRIATDLHDHIGASLSRIAMTIEVMRLQASASPDSGRMLGEIADTARSLIEDMSDIVWSIDPRRDTLGDLVGRLRAFGFGILEPRGIHWTFEAPEDSLHRSLAPGQRRQLYLILKEALHNVARHSQGLNAVLRIQFHGGDLRAEIEDDGRGYRHDAPKGLGIRSMQSRAEQLGGKLEIHSRPQGGTRVSLRFPLSVKDA
jgi:signal transduction histidine kinase/streptogramin lyase